jgi:hypothetical protein
LLEKDSKHYVVEQGYLPYSQLVDTINRIKK